MANYEPIEVSTMVLVEEPEIEYSGVSVSDDRPGQYQVYWQYNPSTGGGGISGDSWPDDIMNESWNLSEALNNLSADNPASIEAVSNILYNYTTNLLAYEDGEDWENFRDHYRNISCLVF